jgi:hypothetical protein
VVMVMVRKSERSLRIFQWNCTNMKIPMANDRIPEIAGYRSCQGKERQENWRVKDE